MQTVIACHAIGGHGMLWRRASETVGCVKPSIPYTFTALLNYRLAAVTRPEPINASRPVRAIGLQPEIASYSVVRVSEIPKPLGELNQLRDCCQHTSDAHN
jgi:hypothetical protein